MENPYDQGFKSGFLGRKRLPPKGQHERQIYLVGYRDGAKSARQKPVLARWVLSVAESKAIG